MVDADGGPWFTKLHGAGQGPGALVAEIVVAELAEAIGLQVPGRVLVRIPPSIESADRDGELRALLDASVGLNLGFTYLDGARDLTVKQIDMVSRDDAAAIVWLDGLVMNPDRTRAQSESLVVAQPIVADRPRRVARVSVCVAGGERVIHGSPRGRRGSAPAARARR